MQTAVWIVVGFLAIVGLLAIFVAWVFLTQSDFEGTD
jgi:hypothetical protein